MAEASPANPTAGTRLPGIIARSITRSPDGCPSPTSRRQCQSFLGTRKIPVTEVTDPGKWAEEVVKALSTRLPGGAPVTQACIKCGSVFNPCICMVDTTLAPHSRLLRCPKVVQAAEQRRLGTTRRQAHSAIGNLGTVSATADTTGADKGTLQILGPIDNQEGGIGFATALSRTSKVLWREGFTFVVQSHLSDSEIQLDNEQLKALLTLTEERADDGQLAVKSHSADQAVKTVEIAFHSAEEARKDLELQEVHLGFEVKHTDPKGPAYAAGVRAGMLLIGVDRLLKERDRQDTWLPYNIATSLPALFKGDAKEVTMKHRGQETMPEFPCRLVFDVLPPGRQVLTVRLPGSTQSVPATWPLLQEQAELGEAGSITITGTAGAERIDSSDVLVVHKHTWDQEGFAENRQEDCRLVLEFLIRPMMNGMTPAHVNFVFKRLLAEAKERFEAVEVAKQHHKQVLLGKSARCVKLKKLDDHSGTRTRVVANYTKELHTLFEQMPRALLEEILHAEEEKSVHGKARVWNHCRTKLHDAKDLVDETEAYRLPMKHQDLDTDLLEQDTEVWQFLLEQAKVFLDRNPAPATRDPPQAGKKDLNSLDARLTFRDFESLMLRHGVTWMGREQMIGWFEDMDKNASGFLNVGEILGQANQVLQLIRRVDSYQAETIKRTAWNCRHELSDLKVVEGFHKLLSIGEDLIGDAHSKNLPDEKIRASTCFCDKPEFGLDNMQVSRIGSKGAWVAKARRDDKTPWLLYEFLYPVTITLVVTQGCPQFEAWVTKFRLRYLPFQKQEEARRPGNDPFDPHGAEVLEVEDVFEANGNRNSPKETRLQKDLVGVVKLWILPVEWYPQDRSPAMRASCRGFKSTPQELKEGKVAQARPKLRMSLSKPSLRDSLKAVTCAVHAAGALHEVVSPKHGHAH